MVPDIQLTSFSFTLPSVLDSEGDYLLVLRFSSVQDEQFPEIPLRVLSPLEAIQHCIPVSSEHIEKPPVLAAVVAYLIQCGKIGRKESRSAGDEILHQILQCMYMRKLPIMSVPGFLCGRCVCIYTYMHSVFNV